MPPRSSLAVPLVLFLLLFSMVVPPRAVVATKGLVQDRSTRLHSPAHSGAGSTATAVAGDEQWDDRFGPPGVDGGGWYTNLFSNPPRSYDATQVFAIAASGDDLYVGGAFTSAGGKAANYIAHWSSATNTWSPLGSGLNGSVSAIVVNGSDVYAGGNFTRAGEVEAIHIARWDSTTGTWSALGSGLGDPATTGERVMSLAFGGGQLYAGGAFARAGSLPVNNVARWDGSKWSALGSGTDGRVEALAVDASGGVYAGGLFQQAGGGAASGIARWNGSAWSALGGGVSGGDEYVRDITIRNTTVYVSGNFTAAGDVPARNIARWDGTQWAALGEGINTIYGVGALAFVGGDLFVGGTFDNAGGVPVHNVARWNGSRWSAVGMGVVGTVSDLTAAGGSLYAGGFFRLAGSVVANKIARWDGESWQAIGPGSQRGGIHNAVSAVAVSGEDVYVGGHFNEIGEEPDPHDDRGDRFRKVARWNSATNRWSPLGEFGVASAYWYVSEVVANGDDVYIGGWFRQLDDGIIAQAIARWNKRTNSWSTFGVGVGRPDEEENIAVSAIALGPGGELYAGGRFTYAGSGVVNNIARWDGNNWSSLGTGISGGEQLMVEKIVVHDGKVYVGGEFTSAGGVPANGLAVWDGRTWAAVDSSFAGHVQDIAFQGDAMYVGGSFTAAGIAGRAQVARWDSSSWSVPGGGVSVPNHPDYPLVVYAIAVDGDDVYVGGNFTLAGGVSANGIARWDGTSWAPLGSGVVGGGPVLGSYVADIAIGDGSLYAGGNFTGAGNKPSSYFGRYELGGEEEPGDAVFFPLMKR